MFAIPLGTISPSLAGSRGTARHTVLHQPGTQSFDDVYDNFYPQASSQWDSVGHVAYAPDEFYNGATEAEVQSGTRNTIEHWAQHGIAGRAVLLDFPLAMQQLDGLTILATALPLASRNSSLPGAEPASSSPLATSSCCTRASLSGTCCSRMRRR